MDIPRQPTPAVWESGEPSTQVRPSRSDQDLPSLKRRRSHASLTDCCRTCRLRKVGDSWGRSSPAVSLRSSYALDVAFTRRLLGANPLYSSLTLCYLSVSSVSLPQCSLAITPPPLHDPSSFCTRQQLASQPLIPVCEHSSPCVCPTLVLCRDP